MSQPAVLTLTIIAVAVPVVRYYWNLRRFPLIACSKCHGNSMRTKWIWHTGSFRFRKIGGHCGRCGGQAWTARSGAGQ